MSHLHIISVTALDIVSSIGACLCCYDAGKPDKEVTAELSGWIAVGKIAYQRGSDFRQGTIPHFIQEEQNNNGYVTS